MKGGDIHTQGKHLNGQDRLQGGRRAISWTLTKRLSHLLTIDERSCTFGHDDASFSTLLHEHQGLDTKQTKRKSYQSSKTVHLCHILEKAENTDELQ